MNELAFYTDRLGLPQVALTGVTVTKTTIEIACTLTDTRTLCPCCGVVCTVVNDRTTRRLRDLNISERAVYLVVSVRQFRCPTGGSCPTERQLFTDANKSYPYRQARYGFARCRKQAYREVGDIVDRHAKTVERLVLDHCRQASNCPSATPACGAWALTSLAITKAKSTLSACSPTWTRARWSIFCRTARKKPSSLISKRLVPLFASI